MANRKSNGKKNSSLTKGRTKAQRQAEREAAAFVKSHKKGVITAACVILVIIIAAALIIYFCFPDLLKRATDAYLDYTKQFYADSADDDPSGTNGKTVEAIPAGNLSDISGAEYSIHFLELGNKYTGDCTLIKCGDTEVLIDAGSRKSSATTIQSYLDQYVEGDLDFVIATHAHQDHIAGFIGNGSGNNKTGILYQYNSAKNNKIGTIIQFAGHNTTSGTYDSYVQAVNFAKDNGTTVYTAKQCWYETDGAAKSYALNDDGTLTLNILYNYYYDNATSDENDYSVCVLLSYVPTAGSGEETKHYLFTGDLEGKGEEYLVKYNTLPEVELFKGGHHGSKTSSTEELLKVIKPKNVAVCCCAGATEYTSANENTFPTQAFVDRISKYTQNVYCTTLCIDYKKGEFTSMNGNIVFYYGMGDGESKNSLKLWFSGNDKKLKDTDWFKNNRTCPEAWK